MKYDLSMKNGFTLIELLIVVAIIAILAAIAIPNFLQAQVRAKVSAVKEGMQTCATALESYYVDYNSYPLENNTNEGSGGSDWDLPTNLTTPISYIASVPTDVFDLDIAANGGQFPIKWNKQGYDYGLAENTGDGNAATDIDYPKLGAGAIAPYPYVIWSTGPGEGLARADALLGGNGFEWYVLTDKYGYDEICQPYRYWYNPTNGTVSLGYVCRLPGGVNSP